MNKRVLIFCGLVAFVAGALLSLVAGHGGFGRNIRGTEAKFAAANSPAKGASVLRGADEGDMRLSRVLSATQESSDLKRGHDLFLATHDLSATDIVELMAKVEKLPPRYARQLRKALLQQWLDVDPPAAEAWIHVHPADGEAWQLWAEHSPERALAEIHAHPECKWARSMIYAAIPILAAPADQKSWVQALAALPRDSARDAVLAERVGLWAEDDRAAAFAFARSLPTGDLRTQASKEVLGMTAMKDPIDAMRLTSAMLPEMGGDLLSWVAGRAAKKDRTVATQWVAGLPEAQRAAASDVIARTWAATDPVGALNWTTGNGAQPSNELIQIAMSGGSSETLQWIQSLPEGASRDKLLFTALAWDSKFNSAEKASASAGTMLDCLSALPPETQLLTARALGSAGFAPERVDRSKAWIAALPDGPLRAAAIEGACETYRVPSAETLPPELQQYLDGPYRDTALQGMAKGAWQNAQPQKAAETALQIADPDTQRATLDSFMPDWLHRDPAKAEAWLQKNGVMPQDWIAEWREESQWGH